MQLTSGDMYLTHTEQLGVKIEDSVVGVASALLLRSFACDGVEGSVERTWMHDDDHDDGKLVGIRKSYFGELPTSLKPASDGRTGEQVG